MVHVRRQDAFKQYYASAKTPIGIISRSMLYVRRMQNISRQNWTIIQATRIIKTSVTYNFYIADWVLNYMIRNYFYKEPLQGQSCIERLKITSIENEITWVLGKNKSIIRDV